MDKLYHKNIILPSVPSGLYDEKPVCRCSICSEPVYRDELVHFIEGRIICPDCFFDFAFDYFSADLIPAANIRR